MGGGASILAAARNPKVVTVANLAAAETNPSAKAAAATVAVSVRFIGGDRDTIAPVADHQRPMYDAKPPATQLRVIVGGSHCGFMDSGSLFCDSGSNSRTTQLQHTRRLLTEWFLLYLAGDTSYDDAAWGAPAQNDPQVGFEGVRAFNGSRATMWHTEWMALLPRHPHEITLDLGESLPLQGFVFLPREGGGNGTIADYECYLGDDPCWIARGPSRSWTWGWRGSTPPARNRTN